MDQQELKANLVNDLKKLIDDLAASETVLDSNNPFARVTVSEEFKNAKLSAPVMSKEELNKIVSDIDKAMAADKSLKDVVDLLKQALPFLV